MKTGLFGGSFDPIHKGHLSAAETARKKLGLDRVIFIPSGVSPHKSLSASALHRFYMTGLAVSDKPYFSVSDFETKKETKCYSVETVEYFKSLYPDDELYFIIGDDEYSSFDKWYKYEELLSMCRFAVVTRNGGDIRLPFIGVPMDKVLISSSMIRELLKSGKDISPYVPASLNEYIKKHGLYKKEMTVDDI